MNVAVVDNGRDVKTFARMEDAWLGSVDIAITQGAVNNFRAFGYAGVEDFEEAVLEPPDPAWVADYFERQA